MPTLTIQLPGLPPVAHLLKDDTITVGRMKGNTIVIEDASVSLSHARITRKNGEFFLKDLNSTNGTILNGQPVVEVKLRDQDRVRFADINGQFLADIPETATVVAGPPVVAQSASAPVAARPAPAAPKPAPSRRAPAFSFSRMLNKIVPVIGVAAAVAVVSAVGWRMSHLGRDSADGGAKLDSSANLASAEPAGVAGQAQTAAPGYNANPLLPSNETTDNPPVTAAQWIAALKSDDPTQRRQAVTALHALGPDAMEAVPALRVALGDTDPEVRMWAAVTLVNDKSYDKATIPILLGILRQDDPTLRQVACLSLALIPYEPAEKETVAPILTETAGKDTSEDVRKAAVTALNIIAPEALAKAGIK